jgi:endoglycosylceramidase
VNRRHCWLIALIASFVLVAAASPATAGVWAGIGAVRAPGGPFLRDQYGRSLELEGADLVGKCGGGAVPQRAAGTPCVGPASGSAPAYILSPSASDPGRRFTAADARSLAQLGFSVVRLGVVWEGLEPGPPGSRPNDPRYCAPHPAGRPFASLGAADPYRPAVLSAYLARTDRIVRLLSNVGLRVIIDMHQDAYGSAFADRRGPLPWNGEGAPAWATCTDGSSFAGRSYWGFAYTAPTVKTAIDHFWHNDVRGDLQGQFARVWQAVAHHYRGDPDVIGYEVLNEPTDFSTPDFNRELQCAYAGVALAARSCAHTEVQALPRGLIGAIQDADPDHLVFFEPMVAAAFTAANAVGITEPLRFANLVLAVHIYGTPPAGVYGCDETTCLRSEEADLKHLIAERSEVRTLQPGGPAMIMDEFGGGPSIPDIAQVVELARQNALSWSYWSALQLHDPTGAPGENLLNDRTGNPWPDKAQVLAGPYPLATAGTPLSQAFDPRSGSFALTYDVDRAIHAPTVVVVPPYTYPHGYRALVGGATVISQPNASLLRLRASAGSQRVGLVLAPVSPPRRPSPL